MTQAVIVCVGLGVTGAVLTELAGVVAVLAEKYKFVVSALLLAVGLAVAAGTSGGGDGSG